VTRSRFPIVVTYAVLAFFYLLPRADCQAARLEVGDNQVGAGILQPDHHEVAGGRRGVIGYLAWDFIRFAVMRHGYQPGDRGNHRHAVAAIIFKRCGS